MTHGSLSLDKGIMMLISVAVDSCFMLLSVVLCFFFSPTVSLGNSCGYVLFLFVLGE